MKILFHMPAPNTIYAGRTIVNGYKHAFEELGHEFRFLTPDDDQQQLFKEYQPNLFFSGFGPFTFRYLDFNVLSQAKKRGTKIFVNIPFWHSPLAKSRINEVPSLSQNQKWVELIRSGQFGDVYYNICEQGDERMAGFAETTGYHHYTVLLAADKTLLYPEFDQKFSSDIAYVGTYLPDKRDFFQEYVFPLKKNYDLKLYGQDWTFIDRQLAFMQKVGQYFNLPIIRSLQRPKLQLEDERKIYSSTKVCINIHEAYQKKYGDINERTFKILCAGGLQVIDNVPTLSKYFENGKQIIITSTKNEWFEKIAYFISHPDEARQIGEEGRKQVLKKHTYHHRVEQLLKIYATL